MSKSARISMRLEEEARKAVERLAEQQRRPKSEVMRELLEESIRMRLCPGIVFVNGPTGRRPVIAGTGLEVWEVIATYQMCEEKFEALASAYDWLTSTQLRSGLAYYHHYPDEINEAIHCHNELSESVTQERYSHLFPPK